VRDHFPVPAEAPVDPEGVAWLLEAIAQTAGN
jgi:hypothetical protein